MNDPVRRPEDAWPAPLPAEYRRLAALPHPCVTLVGKGDNFEARPVREVRSLAMDACWRGQDYAGLVSAVEWVKRGPKIADVTEEQFEALSRVEVRLEVKDFTPPYRTLLVNMPPGKMHRFVLLCMYEAEWVGEGKKPILIASSISHTNQHDIITVARQTDGTVLEKTLSHYYGDVSAEEGEATRVCLRVACNMALAMANFGCQSSYLFPAEVGDYRRFIAKGDRPGRTGVRPSQRLKESPLLITLDRNVKLYHREGGNAGGKLTDREMPFHWRRGHWRRLTDRTVFVRPCMVRADRLGGASPSDTTTTYRK